MTTATFSDFKSAPMRRLGTAGAIAGLGGGLVFGILMGMMGMLPLVGMLIRIENAIVGFVVHMVISAFIGVTFGLTLGRFVTSWVSATILGLLNGVIWWVLGALFLMPLLLGMNQMIFVIEQAQWMSLLGHLMYGLIAAWLFIPLAKRG